MKKAKQYKLMNYKLFTFIVYFIFFTYHNNVQTQNISFDAIKKPLLYRAVSLGAVALAAAVLVIYLRKTKSKNNQNEKDNFIFKIEKNNWSEGEIINRLLKIGKANLENTNKLFEKVIGKVNLRCEDIKKCKNSIKVKVIEKLENEIQLDELCKESPFGYIFNNDDKESLKRKIDKNFSLIKYRLDFLIYYFSVCLGEKVKRGFFEKLNCMHKDIACRIQLAYDELKSIINDNAKAKPIVMNFSTIEKNLLEENKLIENNQRIEEAIKNFTPAVKDFLKKSSIFNEKDIDIVFSDVVLETMYTFELNKKLKECEQEVELFLNEKTEIYNVLEGENAVYFEPLTLSELIDSKIFNTLKESYGFFLEKLDKEIFSLCFYNKFESNVNEPLKAYDHDEKIILANCNEEDKCIILYQVDWQRVPENSKIFSEFNQFLLLKDLTINSYRFENDYKKIILLNIFHYMKNMSKEIYEKHFSKNVKLFFENNPCIFTRWFLNFEQNGDFKSYGDILFVTLCGKYNNSMFEAIVLEYINNNSKAILFNYKNKIICCKDKYIAPTYTGQKIEGNRVQSLLYETIFTKRDIYKNAQIKHLHDEINENKTETKISKLKSYFTLPKIYYKQHMGCGCCSLNALESILNDMLWKEDDNYREWYAENKK